MPIELVTGSAGEAHISGADVARLIAGIVGTGAYSIIARPSVAMSNANTVAIGACDLILNGRHVRLTGTSTLGIANGQSGARRSDLVYVRYAINSSGVETATLGVKQGTAGGTAKDPTLDYPASILDGASTADVAIARVTLDGLTPTATWLLPLLGALGAAASTSYVNDVKAIATDGVNRAKAAQNTANSATTKANNAQGTANTANSRINKLVPMWRLMNPKNGDRLITSDSNERAVLTKQGWKQEATWYVFASKV